MGTDLSRMAILRWLSSTRDGNFFMYLSLAGLAQSALVNNQFRIQDALSLLGHMHVTYFRTLMGAMWFTEMCF